MQRKEKKLRLGFLGQSPVNDRVVEKIEQESGFEVTAVCQAAEIKSARSYQTLKPFLNRCDAIAVMDLSFADYNSLRELSRESKHIYLDQPALLGQTEMRKLQMLQYEAGIHFQLSHKHRFSPTFRSIEHMDLKPRIIECNRYIKHSQKSVKISVVSDLMFPDIDNALRLAGSPLKSVHATGVGIYDKDPDVVNCRLEFYNGCIAILSASKVSDYEVHKTRIFQNQTFITLNHINHTVIVKSGDTVEEKYREPEMSLVTDDEEKVYLELLVHEMKLFSDSLNDKQVDLPGLNEYINAKFVAGQIYDQLERNFIQSGV
jgi:predicted dehydrogenase